MFTGERNFGLVGERERDIFWSRRRERERHILVNFVARERNFGLVGERERHFGQLRKRAERERERGNRIKI